MTGERAAEPLVTAHGTWREEVPPELARLRVEVGARGPDRATTLTQVTSRVDAVRATVATYGDAVERVDARPMRMSAQLRRGKPTERVDGYAADVALRVTVVDFGVLGDLLLRLADNEMVSVDGPYWELRPDSPAYTRARVEAVRSARRVAAEYAEALGSRLTGLVEISDADAFGGFPMAASGAGEERFVEAADSGRRSVADAIELHIDPVPQRVAAAVKVRCTLAQIDVSPPVSSPPGP